MNVQFKTKPDNPYSNAGAKWELMAGISSQLYDIATAIDCICAATMLVDECTGDVQTLRYLATRVHQHYFTRMDELATDAPNDYFDPNR